MIFVASILSILGILNANLLRSLTVENAPEPVARVFMKAVMDGDSQAARILCYDPEPVRVNLILALTEVSITDMSPDHMIYHIPSFYHVLKTPNGGVAVDVYDQNNVCFHTLKFIYIDEKWQIADVEY
ncbi:MAG: hypothetical protein ABFD04_12155 [Syntrophomonas sp.]